MNNDLPNRKPTRLREFDYSSAGAYFVTICTQDRKCIFEIENNFVGNDLRVVPCLQNQILHKWLNETQNKFNNMKIDKYVIMPNHLHLIVFITERHAGRSLQDAIRFFKTMTTNEYMKGVKNNIFSPFNKKLWQKSFYDHIIRDEKDYKRIYEYIENNPSRWKEDKLYIEQ